MSNDLPYNSDRVSLVVEYDSSNRRHQTHWKILVVDGIEVHRVSWTTDDDFPSCSDPEPSEREVYDSWRHSLIN